MGIQHDKKAIFLDKNGNIQIAIIRYIPNEILWIVSYNKEQQKTGYINLYFHPNKRIFLKDYSNYIIRGVKN